jgi:ABC-type uncharacterized transport system auxiliary subunit
MTQLRPLRVALAAVAAASALGGCATAPQPESPQLADRPETVTGSNIPRRDRVGVVTVDPKAVQELLNSISKSGRPVQ